jgi:hypothetical protein
MGTFFDNFRLPSDYCLLFRTTEIYHERERLTGGDNPKKLLSSVMLEIGEAGT